MINQIPGHPIQQFGMAGLPPTHTEIVGSKDQALAKMMHPDAIDHHPGKEWVADVGNPIREMRPSTAIIRLGSQPKVGLQHGQCLQPTGSHLFTFLLHFPAMQHMGQPRWNRSHGPGFFLPW